MTAPSPPLPPGGCLTAADLALLRVAVPGQAPAHLASHLAGCPRCQRRLLEIDAPRVAHPTGSRRPRPLLATLIVAALGLLALLALVLGSRG